MAVKALGISGSPVKNSNTDRLVNAILAATGLETDFVKLSRINVRPCFACKKCVSDNICRINRSPSNRDKETGCRMKPLLMTTCAVTSFMIILFTMIATPGLSAEIVATDKALVKYDTGVVYDPEEGLEWYAGPDRGMSWQAARNWVAALDAAGGGWRMPARRELKTLFRISDGFNDITPLLNNSGYWIWAGQTEDTASKWVFSFSYGGEGWNGPAPVDGGRVLAVRIRTK